MTFAALATLSFMFKAFGIAFVSAIIGQVFSYYAGVYFINNNEKSIPRLLGAVVFFTIEAAAGLASLLSFILNIALFVINAVKA